MTRSTEVANAGVSFAQVLANHHYCPSSCQLYFVTWQACSLAAQQLCDWLLSHLEYLVTWRELEVRVCPWKQFYRSTPLGVVFILHLLSWWFMSHNSLIFENTFALQGFPNLIFKCALHCCLPCILSVWNMLENEKLWRNLDRVIAYGVRNYLLLIASF